MSELIRRQDAELILAREMYATSLEGGCDPVSPMDFLPEARAWLSDAPTMCGWIPCSERLPEKDGYYLVTDNCGEVEIVKYDIPKVFEMIDRPTVYADGGWWKPIDGYIDNVIAWMPLPEPYEAS